MLSTFAGVKTLAVAGVTPSLFPVSRRRRGQVVFAPLAVRCYTCGSCVGDQVFQLPPTPATGHASTSTITFRSGYWEEYEDWYVWSDAI